MVVEQITSLSAKGRHWDENNMGREGTGDQQREKTIEGDGNTSSFPVKYLA